MGAMFAVTPFQLSATVGESGSYTVYKNIEAKNYKLLWIYEQRTSDSPK